MSKKKFNPIHYVWIGSLIFVFIIVVGVGVQKTAFKEELCPEEYMPLYKNEDLDVVSCSSISDCEDFLSEKTDDISQYNLRCEDNKCEVLLAVCDISEG